MRTHLQPTAPIAADAVLPSDPEHALLLAQELLEAPRMSNHSHGLWGYHGRTAAGRALTVQSTGIGGPSAAIVLAELHDLGARRVVRVGKCMPVEGGPQPGEMLVAERALATDGTSRALGADGSVPADVALSKALTEAAGPTARAGAVASADLLPHWARAPRGALAVDLESAALLALGARLRLAVAAILLVTSPDRPPRADRATVELGRAASAALAGEAPIPGAQDASRRSGIPGRA